MPPEPRAARAAARHGRHAAAGRRLLQLTVLLLCTVPIGAGAAGVLLGPGLVAVPGAGVIDLDSHFRYLSGLLLAIGLLFAGCVPHIERRTGWFRLGTAIVFCGGLARLLSLVLAGVPSPPHLVALALELVVVPLLALWQAAVARDFGHREIRAREPR